MSNTQWYPAANERGVVGRFEYMDLIDVPASKAADEKKTKPIIVLREKVAASTDDTVRKVKPETQEEMIRRFPDAWKAFQGEVVPVSGTPLSEIGFNADKTVMYRLHGIMNVEQLAQLSDAQCQIVGFGTKKIRDQAQDHLRQKQEAANATVLKMATEHQERLAQRDGETVEQFIARITPPAEPVKNRGGRPPGSKNKSQAA